MAGLKYLFTMMEVISLSNTNYVAVVNTSLGPIEGLTTRLNTLKIVDAFLGIPYAMAPTGQRRFASPQPIIPWNGTLQAKQISAGCIESATAEEKQLVWFISQSPESEDCLHLNVWRPSGGRWKNLAVMIWIHGGAYTTGSGNLPIYDGSILSTEENIIIVTFNYRLTIFGGLYLGIPEAPANVNLQDQILAIKWVHDNIASFGGDPSKVTLAGESVGGISVGFHLVNPAVRTLFRNAIFESGSPNLPPVANTPQEALNTSIEAAKKIGCVNSNVKTILKCLRQKTSAEILAPYNHFQAYLKLPFPQVANGIEVCEDLQNCAATVPRKPILLGTMKNELNFLLKFLVPGTKIDDNTIINETQWKKSISAIFSLQDDRLLQLVMEPYQGVDYNPKQVRLEIGSFMSDPIIICPLIGFAEQFVSANTYMYSFTQRLSKPRSTMPSWIGPVHGDAIPYIFGAPLDSTNGFPANEILFSRKIMGYWAQFVKTSDPNDMLRIGSTPWPKFDPINKKYLSLGINSFPAKDLKKRECNFWVKSFSKLASLQTDIGKCNIP